jgi:hypothetical protein
MLQNIPEEKIMEIVRLGPTLPVKVAKQIGGGVDTMLIGAMLSSLIASGKVFVSTLKVGGSPLYYVPEHESKLEEFLSYLNEKDRRAFVLLKEKNVLADSSLDPLTRVSLRTIKDFAKPLEVDISGQKTLFWRYYQVSRDDAIALAKNPLKEQTEQTEQTPVIKEQPMAPESVKIEQSKPASKPEEQEHLSEAVSIKAVDDTKHAAHETHAIHKHKEIHKETKTHSELPIHTSIQEVQEKVSETATHPVEQVKTHEHHKVSAPIHKESKPEKIKLAKEPKVDYDFYGLILDHILKKGLDLISKEKIKKSEYSLILKNHTNNEYIYCKAKDKPTLNEGDLAPALIFAQNKKMPCLFLSTGNLTKNVEAMMSKEFSGMVFERIDIIHLSQQSQHADSGNLRN